MSLHYLVKIRQLAATKARRWNRLTCEEADALQVNWNVFKFTLSQPRKMIRETGRTVRGRLLNSSVSSFAGHLTTACDRMMAADAADDDGGWRQTTLLVLTARTMFDAIFNTVFGRDDSAQFNSELAYHNFQARYYVIIDQWCHNDVIGLRRCPSERLHDATVGADGHACDVLWIFIN